MVKAEDSWLYQLHSACHLPNFNCMSSPLQQGQENVFPSSTNRCTFSPDAYFQGFRVPGLCGLGPALTNGAYGITQFFPNRFDSLPSTFDPYAKEEPYVFDYGHGFKATPNVVSGSTEKKFVIFDQSENRTRLFFSPLCSPAQNPIVTPTIYLGACDLGDEGQPAKMGHIFPTMPTIQEKSDENQIIGEGSEMHEDTEEINALLYSDDDGYDSEEDDEVTSTDRSPFAIKESYKKRERMEETTVEFASPGSPMKRQRLIEDGYKKSSSMNVLSSAELNSSCANGRIQGKDLDSILGTQQSRKDKIRETLKIFESLIPGVHSQDPLLVIDEAISYLKYLKLKAKALGVC